MVKKGIIRGADFMVENLHVVHCMLIKLQEMT